MRKEEYDTLKYFLYSKLNSDMSPVASDKFIPLLVRELGEIEVLYNQAVRLTASCN